MHLTVYLSKLRANFNDILGRGVEWPKKQPVESSMAICIGIICESATAFLSAAG